MTQKLSRTMVLQARELWVRYGGRRAELIEREMRARGWSGFYRQVLYSRRVGGKLVKGWPERFGWTKLLSESQRALIERRKRSSRTRFDRWLADTFPEWSWHWKYQRHIYKHLARVTQGRSRRLMIFMPPRHGKSEMVTVRYTAWRLLRDVSLNVIIGSYNQKLADKFSRKIKRIVQAGSPPYEGGVARRFLSGRGGSLLDNPLCQDSSLAKEPPRLSRYKTSGHPPLLRKEGSFKRLNSVSDWETSGGGVVRSVGVGGGIAGFGAGLIVIDDPVRNRADAESATYRDRVWDWFNDDIYTRLEPGAAIVLIQTRWHEDDLAGRLLKEAANGGETWDVLWLPAVAESEIENGEVRTENAEEAQSLKGTKLIAQGKAEGRDPGNSCSLRSDPVGVEPSTREVAPLQGANGRATFPGVTLPSLAHPRLLNLSPSATGKRRTSDPLGRRPGEALCPERFDETALEKIKKKIGSYSFAALYQQSPVPAEGGRFKRAWFKNIVDRAPDGLRWARGYDLAISTKTSADYTASFRCAKDKAGNLYIADGFRKRIEYPEQRRFVVERMRAERNTEHGIEEALHGKAFVQELRRDTRLTGMAFRGVRVDGDKLTRALAWLNLAEEGKVILVRGAWIDEFVDEVCRFPSAKHDDQVDAVSLAAAMLARVTYRAMAFD